MRKMIKKLLINTLLVIMILLPVTVRASESEIMSTEEVEIDSNAVQDEESYVYDYAGLLTSDEIMALEMQIADMREKTDWDIFAVTTDDAEGKISAEYADDFYDERTPEESDGILVLIDMDNRENYISTYGEAVRYLMDYRIEKIADEGFYYVSDGEYASCLSAMLYTAEEFYDEGIPQDQYNEDVETGDISEYRTLTGMEVITVLFLAVGVGWIIYTMVVKSYSMKGNRYDYPYMKYSKVDVVKQEDRFIRQYVTHQRIQTNSGGRSGGQSSNKSSTHTSSSGRSHGGGGRKF